MRFTRGFGDGSIALERPQAAVEAAQVAPAPAHHGNLPRWRRSPPTARDLNLSSLAAAWRDRFTHDVRPVALCSRYPRIANRLALCWDDPALTAKVFHDVLVDRRGSRRGFPPDVQRELLALRDHRAV
jgi:hypothetical protein